MNLNLHIVEIAPVSFGVRMDLEDAAYEALVSDDATEEGLMAMAELVDWEHAVMTLLTGLGQRCQRALRQRLLSLEDGRALERMAGRSAVVNELFNELTRSAEGVHSAHLLAA